MACEAFVVTDSAGRRLGAPRPCKHPATSQGLCPLHALVRARRPLVDVRPGGFCVGCGLPATTYAVGGVSIMLCGRCGGAVARAIREGRG